MRARHAGLLALAFPLLSACAGRTGGALSSPRSLDTDALAQEVRIIADNVEGIATSADGRAGRFAPTATAAQRLLWDSSVDRWLSQLRVIDARRLIGRSEWVIYGVMREGLEANAGLRVCRDSANLASEACYEARLRASTTLPLKGDEVIANGKELRRTLEAELRPLSMALIGTADVNEARRRFRSEPQFMSGSREAMFNATNEALVRARARMPEWFLTVPPDTLVLVEAPRDIEATAGAPAWYQRATSERPAQFVLNTYKPEERPRMNAYVAAVHEGYPGHHHQIALAARRDGGHPVTALFPMTGYIEGWGLYSERLADEMQIYPSGLERAWYLAHLTDAALGMILDPLINRGRITREATVDSMVIVAGRPRWEAENYAARHLRTPTQLVTYAVGYQEIMRLREDARRRLGARFDIRAFHERVLEDGEVTLPMLREKIERWVAAGGPR